MRNMPDIGGSEGNLLSNFGNIPSSLKLIDYTNCGIRGDANIALDTTQIVQIALKLVNIETVKLGYNKLAAALDLSQDLQALSSQYFISFKLKTLELNNNLLTGKGTGSLSCAALRSALRPGALWL